MAVSVTSVLDAAVASLNAVSEVVTICTTRFSIKNFRSAFCFLGKRTDCFPMQHELIGCIIEAGSIYCAVGTEFSNLIQVNLAVFTTQYELILQL
jgi:hypothetical protein